MLRLIVTAALLCVAGCVSDEVVEAARVGCEARQTPPEQMNACRERMEATIQSARNYRPPTTPPNQPPN
ncbi:MAG: hypothetical protein NW206_10920 [Hyphomonadaceae bacterium]|jgi:hypothetical protein|nr:hypothetical protein [Hyphomonadaceae bacterium]